MADTIFINYRREDSAATAGRLHDRLAQAFGRKRIFMDVDQIPAGIDFVAHLNSQVAACNVALVVIGPHWLNVKNEAGERRLHQPDDFVAIEIAAALARDIRVIPVLVDGANVPKVSELPDALKPLVRRQAIEVRQPHFGRDAEALIERVHEALGDKAGLNRWRVRALAGAGAIAALLLIGVGGYVFLGHIVERGVQRAELKLEEERKAADAEANHKVMAAAAKAEQDRQAKVAQDAEAKRQADEAEQQRLAAAKAEQDRQAKVAQDRVDAQNAYNSGTGYLEKGDYDRAIADYNESIRLNPNNYLAFGHRGFAYLRKGNAGGCDLCNDQGIADFSESIRLNPNNDVAFRYRGFLYLTKGNYDQAIADINESIRLNPSNDVAFRNRGFAYLKKGDYDQAYLKKGDYDQAIADSNEAIRLNPNNYLDFRNRGAAYLRKGNKIGLRVPGSGHHSSRAIRA
jgi:tetratricopeptide (TPR) repeat protein